MIAGVLAFVAVLIVAAVVWIVFTPVVATMDTTMRQLEIVQRGTFVMHWTFPGPPIVRIFGVRTSFTNTGAQRIKKPAARKRRPIHKSMHSWLFLIKGCLKSLRVRKLVMDVDTGDVVLNARLVPAMFFLSHEQVALSTNFRGQMYMHVEIEARLNKLLWTWVLFLTKK